MRVAKSISWNILPDKYKKKYIKKWKDIGNTGFHIHCPDASTPKDGPSAGIAITTAIISNLLNEPINHEIGMTGEINLSGNITEIGGLEHKLVGAKKAGVKLVLCPLDNKLDLEKTRKNCPNLIDKNFNVELVDNIYEAFKIIFPKIGF